MEISERGINQMTDDTESETELKYIEIIPRVEYEPAEEKESIKPEEEDADERERPDITGQASFKFELGKREADAE